MVKRFFIILFCFASPSIFATAKSYQIEVLIFSHITSETLSQENWPVIPPVSNPVLDDQSSPQLKTVAPDQFILKKEDQALSKKENYRVLYHAAWQASTATLADKNTIYIQTNTSPLNDSELNGKVTISLNRYFDTHFALYLNEPTSDLKSMSDNSAFENAPKIFHFSLNQNRRMKSQELNYISHPLFGVLIKIIPINT